MMENLYAIIDNETKIILSFPRSYTSAHYVSEGILGTKPVMIPTSLESVYDCLKKYDLKDDVLKFSFDDTNWVSIVPPQQITQEIIKKRKICRLRTSYIYSLEQRFLSISNVRSVIHFDEYVIPFLMSEIKKSNVEKNEYADGIIDYANIQSISPSAAYQEIKFMVESSGLIKIRSQAWFLTFVRKFNTLTSKIEFDEEMKNAWHYFQLWRA